MMVFDIVIVLLEDSENVAAMGDINMLCIALFIGNVCATIVTKNVSGLVRSDNNSYPDHVFIGH